MERMQARDAVARAARGLAEAGLVYGTSGNVSLVCDDGHVAITPTGSVLASLQAEHVTIVDRDGAIVDGALAPTSEIDIHLGAIREHGAGAVVHTHAPASVAVGLLLDELPCVHYEMLALGGSVRVAPYATFGTPELAASVVAALQGRSAALLANHGTVTTGHDLDTAVRATQLLEWASDIYLRAAAVGTPRTLGEAELAAVVEAAVARSYGATRPA